MTIRNEDEYQRTKREVEKFERAIAAARVDFGRALRAGSAQERIAVLDDLLVDLDAAIRLCRDYEPPGSRERPGYVHE
jgi:hypothetical protein